MYAFYLFFLPCILARTLSKILNRNNESGYPFLDLGGKTFSLSPFTII